MEIRSDRHHDFPVAPEVLWDAMSRVDAYQQWWPWLRSFDAAALTVGERWEAVVQPPLPYRLRFSIHLDEVAPVEHVVARVSGDITGSARLHLSETATGSRLHLVSSLEPKHRVLQAVATVAAPVARYGHEWVLDTGLQQFRARALP